ncbi:glucose-6-phosphate dehydrogenase, partial [Streptomyces sp. SID4982]|nr:glucose-6-phosphate dehydrogenase [Streptomyces sp. SID4982]
MTSKSAEPKAAATAEAEPKAAAAEAEPKARKTRAKAKPAAVREAEDLRVPVTPAAEWDNPLRDAQDRRLPRIAGPSGLVIFGVTG